MDRVQCGVRIDKGLLKVLKALAEYLDVSLGDLFELVLVSSLEGAPSFSKGTLRRIADLKRIYGVELTTAGALNALHVDAPSARSVSGAGRRPRRS
jgi:hypothetical protein